MDATKTAQHITWMLKPENERLPKPMATADLVAIMTSSATPKGRVMQVKAMLGVYEPKENRKPWGAEDTKRYKAFFKLAKAK